MNIKIIRIEPKWDNNLKMEIPNTYSINANGLSEKQIKSLIRFVIAGMTSQSIGNRGSEHAKQIFNELLEKGSYYYKDDAMYVLDIEINKE